MGERTSHSFLFAAIHSKGHSRHFYPFFHSNSFCIRKTEHRHTHIIFSIFSSFYLHKPAPHTHIQERNRTKEKQRVRGGDTCQKTTLNFIAGLCYMFALCIVHFCLVCLLFVRFFSVFRIFWGRRKLEMHENDIKIFHSI